MKHLTETQLNEYLDGAFEAPAKARLEAHLSDCADCRARLAAIQAVFQALAALPEETLRHDLTPAVLQSLPPQRTGLGWRLVFAVQAGMSLGFLLLVAPIISGHLTRMMLGLTNLITQPEVKLPAPIGLHFNLPVIQLPHPPTLALPFRIPFDNPVAWLVLVIAAVLLFIVGNFSLIFHRTSETGNMKRRRMP